ncbi:MAG TPA: hypothetical protein VMF52_09530 [Steroidobacteraceae bacterium]|nr:hypothetical protein [Steroidobacteraceae bacterium]
MAVIDPHGDAVVIRIVYDGAPMAGKTTSVVALGRCLGVDVVTPEAIAGRTLYFDWLDYTGGLFEGRRIRCQVVSVPGQAVLAKRRRRLLEAADAIVFVADSTPSGFHADRGYLSRLDGFLGKLPAPPIGVVLQANKRDHPDAVPLDQVQSQLDRLGMRIGLIESVATEGTGVREAFVFAVRLALDRVREQMRLGLLESAPPTVNGAQDLLDDLQRHEGTLPGIEALEEGFAPATPPTTSAGEHHVPAAPDERVASGLVWPPIDGRVILHELTGTRVSLARNPRGDWWGVVNDRWRLTSPADAVYADVELGRSVLVKAAGANAARLQGRGDDRCVVLAADGAGRFRLWNISRVAARE